jgi:Putative 2OG-Fe(II) oxygenase
MFHSITGVNYRSFNWGPYLWQSLIPNNLREDLLESSKKLTIKNNDNLASIIDDVRRFSDIELNELSQKLSPFFQCYTDTLIKDHFNNGLHPISGILLTGAWINIQKKHEMNPEHTHGGDFSFVIYLQMPKELEIENSQYIGTGPGPGAIAFRYGEKNRWTQNVWRMLPREGDIFIFPSHLSHFVLPFKSDCERISMSGNLKVLMNPDAPLSESVKYHLTV